MPIEVKPGKYILVRPVWIYVSSFFIFERPVSTIMQTRMKTLLYEWKITLWYKPIRLLVAFRLAFGTSRNLSRLMGLICRIPLPFTFLRKFILGTYSWWYGCNLEEAEKPISEYSTVHEFFTRKLKPDIRPISMPHDQTAICSPCDGEIFTFGFVDNIDSSIDCVKGRSYELDEFILGTSDK